MRKTGLTDLFELAERVAYEFGPDRERLGAALRDRADDVIETLEDRGRTPSGLALRLVAALPGMWEDVGRVDEGRRLTEMAIEGALPGDPALAGAQLAASEIAFRQGDQAEAERWARAAIDLAKSTGDGRVAALGHVALARVAYRNGIGPKIEAHAQQALELAGDDMAGRRGALHMLAWAAHTVGDLPLARARFEESLALRRAQGDRFGAAVEIANLGDLAAEDGDLAGAADALGQALEVAAELDSQYLILNLLPSLAVVAARSGNDEAAARLIGAMDALSETSGLSPDPGNSQPPLDEANRRLGARFQGLRAEGHALSLADVIVLARRVGTALSKR